MCHQLIPKITNALCLLWLFYVSVEKEKRVRSEVNSNRLRVKTVYVEEGKSLEKEKPFSAVFGPDLFLAQPFVTTVLGSFSG